MVQWNLDYAALRGGSVARTQGPKFGLATVAFFFMEVKSSVAPVLTVSLRIKDPLQVFRINPEPSTTELLVAHVWLGHLKPSKFEIQ